jgi:hypothetical protein
MKNLLRIINSIFNKLYNIIQFNDQLMARNIINNIFKFNDQLMAHNIYLLDVVASYD